MMSFSLVRGGKGKPLFDLSLLVLGHLFTWESKQIQSLHWNTSPVNIVRHLRHVPTSSPVRPSKFSPPVAHKSSQHCLLWVNPKILIIPKVLRLSTLVLSQDGGMDDRLMYQQGKMTSFYTFPKKAYASYACHSDYQLPWPIYETISVQPI